MTTASDLCMEALTISGITGVGQTATKMDINATFTRLNDMLGQFQRKRWLIWHEVETSVIANGKGGAGNPFLVGVGGANDFNMFRPDRLEGAFFRQLVTSNPNQIDYTLEEMKSYQDWANVALKSLKSFPTYYFYDAAYPVGNLYVWPVPASSLYEVHILTKEVLTQFALLSTTVSLPPEYNDAIRWNLARRTRAAYRKPQDAEINALARETLNVLRMANASVARLRMPEDIVRPGVYQIFSDQIR